MLGISIVLYRLDRTLFLELLSSLSISIEKLEQEISSASITIIDNGNQKEAIEAVLDEHKELLPAVNIISGIKNIGYGRAHNLAILPSNHRYHLILNPDVILDPDALREGIEYLEANSSTVAVCPNAHDEKGEIQFLAKSYPSVLTLLLRGLDSRSLQRRHKERLDHYIIREKILEQIPVNVEIISGCFMLCKTEFLKKVGGFDERYFLYFEDFALSKELGKYGSLGYLPDMKILHYGGKSARKGVKHICMFISSGIKFFNQYGWKLI